jgi:hypothetical protein
MASVRCRRPVSKRTSRGSYKNKPPNDKVLEVPSYRYGEQHNKSDPAHRAWIREHSKMKQELPVGMIPSKKRLEMTKVKPANTTKIMKCSHTENRKEFLRNSRQKSFTTTSSGSTSRITQTPCVTLDSAEKFFQKVKSTSSLGKRESRRRKVSKVKVRGSGFIAPRIP